jgi:hypothetical protein
MNLRQYSSIIVVLIVAFSSVKANKLSHNLRTGSILDVTTDDNNKVFQINRRSLADGNVTIRCPEDEVDITKGNHRFKNGIVTKRRGKKVIVTCSKEEDFVFTLEIPPGDTYTVTKRDGTTNDYGATDETRLLAFNVDTTKKVVITLGAGNGRRLLAESDPVCIDASVLGDPHFKTWGAEIGYDYHGEGDFVLLHSDNHENNNFGGECNGLEIQIRTTIHEDLWSGIESAALQIGKHVLQIDLDRVLFDGSEIRDEELPLEFCGNQLQTPKEMTKNKSGRSYRLDLQDGGHINFRVYQGKVGLLSVGLTPSINEVFENSVGLLGNFPTGSMLARDGVTVIDDPDTFGEEWQVRDTESHLFQTDRYPQYPDTPLLPKKSAVVDMRRRLIKENKEIAEAACQNVVDPSDLEACIFDVVVTGDIGIVGAY